MNPSGSNLLLAVPLKFSETYRERITEIVFESLNFQSLFFVSQPLLAAYSSGYANCLVVDSGYSHTGIIAVKGFNALQESERVLPFGGKHIDRFIRKMALGQLDSYSKMESFKQMKCCVSPKALTVTGMTKNAQKESVLLPDGQRISLPSDWYKTAPEMLFNPSLGGLPDVMPLDQAAIISSLALDDNDSYAVLESVVLAGGNTLFRGAGERMKLGIATRTLPRINKRVLHHRSGVLAVWSGGACIASTNTYKKICITKELYKESGAKIVSERWL